MESRHACSAAIDVRFGPGTGAVPTGSLYVQRMSREARRILSLIVPLVAMLLILAPATGSAAKPKNDRHRVDLTGATKNVRQTAGGALIDRGTVSGKPFGQGKIKLVVHLHPEDQTATGTFRIRDHRGTAFGTIDTTFAIEGPEITFRGTADFTGGKGRYKQIRGRDLKAYDHNTLDGQNGMIELKGFVTY